MSNERNSVVTRRNEGAELGQELRMGRAGLSSLMKSRVAGIRGGADALTRPLESGHRDISRPQAVYNSVVLENALTPSRQQNDSRGVSLVEVLVVGRKNSIIGDRRRIRRTRGNTQFAKERSTLVVKHLRQRLLL